MLVYMDRFIEASGLVLNPYNWKRVCFISLIVTQKVWDDYSYVNNDYRTLLPHTNLRDVNEMERTFLGTIRYSVSVSYDLYTKYVHHLKCLYGTKLNLAAAIPCSPYASPKNSPCSDNNEIIKDID